MHGGGVHRRMKPALAVCGSGGCERLLAYFALPKDRQDLKDVITAYRATV